MLSFTPDKDTIPIARIIPKQPHKKKTYEDITDDEKEEDKETTDEDEEDIDKIIKKEKKLKKKREKKYKKPKNLKIIATIYFKPTSTDDDEPEFQVKDPSILLTKHDWRKIKDEFRLNNYQVKQIKQILPRMKKMNISGASLPPNIAGALDQLKDLINHKLRTEFEGDDDIEILPCLDMMAKAQMCNAFVTGSSGAGKSSIINKICYLDCHKRPVKLYTRITHDDPSLQDIQMTGRMEKVNVSNPDDWYAPEKLAGQLVVFDDIESLPNYDEVRGYRDDILQTGRHHQKKGISTSVISVSHASSDYNRTKVPARESAYVILFPSSNKYEASQYLKEKSGMNKSMRDYYLNKSLKQGRYLIVRSVYPQAIITTRGVYLI